MIPDVHRCVCVCFFITCMDLFCSDVKLSSRCLKACREDLQGHSDHLVTQIRPKCVQYKGINHNFVVKKKTIDFLHNNIHFKVLLYGQLYVHLYYTLLITNLVQGKSCFVFTHFQLFVLVLLADHFASVRTGILRECKSNTVRQRQSQKQSKTRIS